MLLSILERGFNDYSTMEMWMQLFLDPCKWVKEQLSSVNSQSLHRMFALEYFPSSLIQLSIQKCQLLQ